MTPGRPQPLPALHLPRECQVPGSAVARAGRRQRARQSLLAALLGLVLLNLGMNFALETIKPEWRDPEYGHRLKELKPLARTAEKPVVVLLGSSRCQMGFDPNSLGLDDTALVYNFSQAGCGPAHQLLNLRRLLAAGVKPDRLIVEVLRPVLGGDAPAEKLFLAPRLSAADLQRVTPYCQDATPLYVDWAEIRLNPWYHLRLNLLCHWGGGSLLPWQHRQDFMWKQMKGRGWLPYFFSEITPEKRAQSTAEAQAQYAGYFVNFHLAELPDRSYRDLLELARAEGIRVAFLVMPESATFRRWYPPGVQPLITDYLQKLSREYDVEFFDASDWLGDETYYADGHHLMRHGAKLFSERLGRETLRPWLSRP